MKYIGAVLLTVMLMMNVKVLLSFEGYDSDDKSIDIKDRY